MVNKCVVFGCKSGYDSSDNAPSFRFPFKRDDLMTKWIQFVNRTNWTPSSNSVICCKHFDAKFISDGKRKKLKWGLNPIPTIHTSNALERPSSLNTPSESRKPPKVRIYQKYQLEDFEKKDAINNFADLSTDHCPAGYTCHKTENCIIFYNLLFDETNEFPVVCKAIKIDSNLHVKLQIYGNPVPLPLWFTEGRNAKLVSISMLENFPNYLQAFIGNKLTLMEELQRRQHYKPQGRPPYSAEMIRFALLVRYTSAQAYKILLQHFPFLSFSLLSKLKSSNVDAIKAAQSLREKRCYF